MVKMLKLSILARLISIVAFSSLAGFYSPHELGVFSLVAGAVAIFSSFSTLRFEWFVPNDVSSVTRNNLTSLALMASFPLCLLPVLLFFTGLVSDTYSELHIGYYIFVSACVLLGSGISILDSWCIKQNYVVLMGRSQVIQSAVSAIVMLSLGYLGFTAHGLLVALLLSVLSGCFFLYWFGSKWFVLETSYRSLIKTANEFLGQSLSASLVSIINVLFLNLMPFLLAAYFSLEVAGFYALASRLTAFPVALISNSVSGVFWAEAALLIKDSPSKLRSKYVKTLCFLSALGSVLVGMLYVAVCWGAPLLVDSDWSSVPAYILALSPFVLGSLIFGSTNHLTIFNKQHYQLLTDILGVLLVFSVFVLCSQAGLSADKVVFFAGVAQLLSYLGRCGLHFYASFEYEGTRLINKRKEYD